jgi:hypothetical protein
VTRSTLALVSMLALLPLGRVATASPAETQTASAAPATAAPASEDKGLKRKIVGVLEIRADGIPAEQKAQFQTNLEAQLDSKHYWLSPESRMHAILANSTKWTDGCLIGKCLAEVKAQTNADLVLLAALSGSGTSFGYVVTLVRTDTGRVLSQKAERCDVCTVNEALTKATKATVALLQAVPDTLPDDDAETRSAVTVATQSLRADVRHDRHARTVSGTVLTVVGIAAAAAGAAIYFTQDHARSGLATAAAGAGLAAGGVVVLTF